MEIEEIVKIIVVVVFLLVLVSISIFLLKEKGSDLLESLKNILRFGR